MQDRWFRGGQTSMGGDQRYVLERYRHGTKYYERTVLWILSHHRSGCIQCDEPVTRRLMAWCDGLATRSFVVVGLFDRVAPTPRAFVGRSGGYVEDWESRLKTQVFRAREVVAAWGDLPPELAPRVEQVLAVIAGEGREVKCVGRTRLGNPKSPLAVRGAPVLEVFRPAAPRTGRLPPAGPVVA
jgi:hypothetical protein